LTWIDPADLPQKVSVCGWDWGASPEFTMTWQEARDFLDADPIVFDPTAGVCPNGACTVDDLRGPLDERGPCQENLWARIGLDQFVLYGILRRL
jgi:hypothetical protein